MEYVELTFKAESWLGPVVPKFAAKSHYLARTPAHGRRICL